MARFGKQVTVNHAPLLAINVALLLLQHIPGSWCFNSRHAALSEALVALTPCLQGTAGALQAHLPLAGVQVVDAAKRVLSSLLALHRLPTLCTLQLCLRVPSLTCARCAGHEQACLIQQQLSCRRQHLLTYCSSASGGSCILLCKVHFFTFSPVCAACAVCSIPAGRRAPGLQAPGRPSSRRRPGPAAAR
jgi:hypothetical protein